MGKSTPAGRRGDRVDLLWWNPARPPLWWLIASWLIRARAELFVAIVMVTVVVTVHVWLTEVQANVVLVVYLMAMFGLPWSRRFVIARVWCVADRHRLRACLRRAKVRTMNRDGSLPLMLWARPTKTGERVWLWIRAGSSGGDIEDALEYIAPACLARSARLHRVRSLATIVAVEIIRRDPLAKSVITSPLSRLADRRSGQGEGTDPITAAPSPALRVVPDLTTPSPRKSSVPTVPARPTVIIGGEDLSDYVD